MANFYGVGRSNYFRVKDIDAFKEAMKLIPVEIEYNSNEGTVCLLQKHMNDYWPTDYYDEEKDEYCDFDWCELIAPHLQPQSVCVIVAVGNEKLRYMTGYTYAIHSTGAVFYKSLDDIYGEAAEEFANLLPDLELEITRAEY